MNPEVIYDRSSICANRDFICIDTWSGYYGSSRDPKGSQHLLPPNADDMALATALLDALSRSRVVLPEEAPDLYPDRDTMAREHEAWIQRLIDRYGYKNKRALFKAMKSCSVHRRRGATITFMPTVHERIEGWGFLPVEQQVVIPADCSTAELGAAMRLALSRCVP